MESPRSISSALELRFPRVTGSTKGPLAFYFLAQVPWMMALTCSGKLITFPSSFFLFPKRVFRYLACWGICSMASKKGIFISSFLICDNQLLPSLTKNNYRLNLDNFLSMIALILAPIKFKLYRSFPSIIHQSLLHPKSYFWPPLQSWPSLDCMRLWTVAHQLLNLEVPW